MGGRGCSKAQCFVMFADGVRQSEFECQKTQHVTAFLSPRYRLHCLWKINEYKDSSYEVLGGDPYHTECVSQLVDHFKAINKFSEKTGNRPNLSKGGGGGTPPLAKNQTISVFFI